MPTARYFFGADLHQAAREAGPPEVLPTPVFAEAVIDEDAMVASAAERPAMIIDLPHGKRLSIFAAAPPTLVAAALKGLRWSLRVAWGA